MEEKLLLKKSAILWVNEYYNYDKEDCILLKVFRKNLTESYDILIDKSDFELVSQGQWYGHMSRKNTHLKNILHILWTHTKNNKKVTSDIYQWILDSKNENRIVDHISMDRQDNRRQNLRFATAKENTVNQEYTGWSYQDGKYCSYIYCDSIYFYLGSYDNKEDAEAIYLKAYIIMGYDKISESCKSRIQLANIRLSEEDCSSKYLNRLIMYRNEGVIPKIDKELIKLIKLSTFQGNGLGYNYDKPTKRYLVRIKINNKEVNIGRYKTEKEANDIYLKSCLITNKNDQYSQIEKRIQEHNIILTEEDYKHKYLKKVYNLYNNIDEVTVNGRFNYTYEENMNIIIKLVNEGVNWNRISQYLRENIKGLEGAKGEMVKVKYNKYIKALSI